MTLDLNTVNVNRSSETQLLYALFLQMGGTTSGNAPAYTLQNPPLGGWLLWVKSQNTYGRVLTYDGSNNVATVAHSAPYNGQTVIVTETFTYTGSNVTNITTAVQLV